MVTGRPSFVHRSTYSIFIPLQNSAPKEFVQRTEPIHLNRCSIINAPVSQSFHHIGYWCVTWLNSAAAYQHPNELICHLGQVKDIMTGFSATILDQITRFIILLSDEGWFSLNKSCDYAFHISKRVGIDECDYQALLIAGHLAMLKGARGEFCHGPDSAVLPSRRKILLTLSR